MRKTLFCSVLQGKSDVNGRILHILITLTHLVGGQWCAVLGTVRHNLVSLIQQPLFPELFEGPPDAFYKIVRHGHVGVVEIDPKTDTFGHFPPGLLILHDRLAAHLIERLYTVFFYLELAGKAKFLLNLNLHRESVAVPAGLPSDEVPLHGLIAWK